VQRAVGLEHAGEQHATGFGDEVVEELEVLQRGVAFQRVDDGERALVPDLARPELEPLRGGSEVVETEEEKGRE